MPKSRNTRKKRVRLPKRAGRKGGRRTAERAADRPAGEAPSPEMPTSMTGLLLAHRSELFFQIVSYAPLLIGSWVSGGVKLPEPVGFALLLAIVVSHHYFELIGKQRLPLSVPRWWFALGGAAAVCGFGWWSGDPLAASIAVFYALIAFGASALPVDSLRRVLLVIAAVLVRCSALAMLGVFSQIRRVVGITAIFGFVPAAYLGAALIALHSPVLENAGWVRQRPGVDRKGEKVMRPGRLSQAFSLLLVIGPAVSTGLAAVGLLPSTFLLTGVPVYFMPKLATAFLEQLGSDDWLGERCIRVAAVAAATMLGAGTIVALS